MVDANSAYTLADAGALPRARRVRPDDGRAAAGLGRHRRPRVAAARDPDRRSASTSRSTPRDDARRALDLGACRIVNVKVGRVGGFAERDRRPRPVPRPRRPGVVRRDAGVGDRPAGQRAPADPARLHACPATRRPARATSRKTWSTRRWWFRMQGTIAVPEGPGIGHAIVWPRVEKATTFREEWRPR